MISLGAGFPNDLRCPTNELRGTEKLNDFIGLTPTSGTGKMPTERAGNYGPWFSQIWNQGTPISGTPKVTGAARTAVVADMVKNGYNTNYASSWFMVRGQARIQATANISAGAFIDASSGFKEYQDTLGPLTIRQMTAGDIPSSNIPMLGDAAPGDADEAFLTDTLLGTDLAAGSRLAEAFNDGPAYWDATSEAVVLVKSSRTSLGTSGEGLPVDATLINTAGGQVWPDTGAIETSAASLARGQGSFRTDKCCQHGSTGHSVTGLLFMPRQLNLLMADGSVKSVTDLNGDGFLNPGFPVGGGTKTTAELAATVGYTDGTVEMSSFEVFNGIMLNGTSATKGAFED